uniref:Uncharacterized protein n=1 Tax=Timema cristinae TaxID=61476 RepID=A0A7R9CXE5_TIMCR|nr:unnamed protein product [Timema cristinae]
MKGITIKPLVKILNVKRAEKRKPSMNERIHERIMDHVMAGIEDILGHHGNHHLRDKRVPLALGAVPVSGATPLRLTPLRNKPSRPAY